jgi:hypothetical protein
MITKKSTVLYQACRIGAYLGTAVLILSACGPAKEVTFKSGGMTHTFAEGKNAIPKDFPLPIYTGASPTGSVSAEGNEEEQSKFLMLSSPDPVDKISDFYQNELKARGWEITNVQTLPRIVSISAQQKDMDGNVMITDDGGKTTISLSVGKTGSEKPDETENENFSPNKVTPPTD